MKSRTLKRNRQLANVVEITKQLGLEVARAAPPEATVCRDHGRPLKRFCLTDQTAVCATCQVTQPHRAHTMVSLEKAAMDYKIKIGSQVESLKNEREKLQDFRLKREERLQSYLMQIKTERHRMVSDFKELHQFLKMQEKLLLTHLGELEKEIVQEQEETLRKLFEEMADLDETIAEMERGCLKPSKQLLKDIKNNLSSWKTVRFQEPRPISPYLEKKVHCFAQKYASLKDVCMQFTENLLAEMNKEKVAVILHPATAHPNLMISKYRRSVSFGPTRQVLPDNPERFDLTSCVLGTEGFLSGRHYWEVEVAGKEGWTIGAARTSVTRKGWLSLQPEKGIWALRLCWDRFQALSSPRTPLTRSLYPRRIRVCLDWEGGWLAFSDADTEAPIFTFNDSFREAICPFFALWTPGSCIRLCP
uniref:Uncharacterized protein n=1 Tax=Sphenodon punctatus TaxID=8508 RepID=A0A8D0G591_SPHPU